MSHDWSLVQVAILWRTDRRQVQYDWLPDGWAGHEQADNGQRLVKKLDLMLRSRNYLPHTAELPSELTDEHMRVSPFSGHLVVIISQAHFCRFQNCVLLRSAVFVLQIDLCICV